jgi:predicted aspartyl protease
MPIADCGFPWYLPETHPDGRVTLHSGQDLLLVKGPTIVVEVGFEATLFADPSKTPAIALAMAQGITVPSTLKAVEALIDTGAAESCIDEDLANELQLPLIDKGKCSGVGGQHELNIYLGHIRIPALNQIQWGRFIGARLTGGGQPHRALIGRAQLKAMILIYDGRTGAVTLST